MSADDKDLRTLLRHHIAYTEEKLEVLCTRTEETSRKSSRIERELIGEVGDEKSQKACVKTRLKDLEARRDMQVRREKFWKVVASGGIVAAVGLMIERGWQLISGHWH